MDILKNTYEIVKDTSGYITQHIATALYNVLPDEKIVIFISVFIVIAPISYVATKLADNFNFIKMNLSISFIVTLFNVNSPLGVAEIAEKAGVSGVLMALVLGIYILFANSYYDGLFGRFRDYD